jgi:hypothetical protein
LVIKLEEAGPKDLWTKPLTKRGQEAGEKMLEVPYTELSTVPPHFLHGEAKC